MHYNERRWDVGKLSNSKHTTVASALVASAPVASAPVAPAPIASALVADAAEWIRRTKKAPKIAASPAYRSFAHISPCSNI